jgi:hypothetical protein
MFQVLAGRAAVPKVTFPAVEWNANFLPPEYALSQAGTAYARSAVNAGNNALRNFVFTDKQMRADQLGGGYGYYWEIDLTGSTVMDGYIGVVDADTAEYEHDRDTDPLYDSVLYRGDGSTWADEAQVAAGFAPYGDGKTLMMAFDPVDGALWTGVDGVWDREPWVDNPAGYSPLGDVDSLSVIIAQARNATDAGVLKSRPDEFTYPVPAGLLPLADTNPNPILRPQWWQFPGSSSTVHSTEFDRSSTFRSTNTLFNNRYALGAKAIGGVKSAANVPVAGYYFEIEVTSFFASDADEVSVGFLPSTQWETAVVPTTLQWRADGRLYFDGAQQFPAPAAWSAGTRLMFCFNPHTGSLWLGQNGVWADDPATTPTFSYGIGLTLQWKVCVQHRAPGIFGVEKGATIYGLPTEFQYPLPSNAIPLAQYV